MEFKVEITMIDEFGQKLVGISHAENLDAAPFHECVSTQLGTLSKHIYQAMIAAGFHPDQVKEIVNVID